MTKKKRTTTVDEVLKSTETGIYKTVCMFVSWHIVPRSASTDNGELFEKCRCEILETDALG